MEFDNLLINTKNNITTISINRPKNLNALNIKTLEEIANAINLSVENDKTKCIIITGVGDKAFIAGADIKEFMDYNSSNAYIFSETGNKLLFEVIENSPKPIIVKKPKNLALKTVNFKTGSDLNRIALEKILQKYTIIKQRIENEN